MEELKMKFTSISFENQLVIDGFPIILSEDLVQAETECINYLEKSNNKRVDSKQDMEYLNIINILKKIADINFAKAKVLIIDNSPINQIALGDLILKATIFYNAAFIINNKFLKNNEIQQQINNNSKEIQKFLIEKIKKQAVEIESSEIDKKHLDQWLKIKKNAEQGLEKVDKINIKSEEDTDAFYERTIEVNKIYDVITEEIKSLLNELINECIAIFGKPPCEYTFISFGSLAKAAATPYSDIEFGILLEEGKDTEENKRYFRNLSYLLAIKIINLGQTIIPKDLLKTANGISIILDDILVPGLQFDLGGKTPLGRKDKSYELMKSPSEMIKYLEDIHFDSDPFLPIQISNAAYLYGSQVIWGHFDSQVKNFFEKNYLVWTKKILLTGIGMLIGDLSVYQTHLDGGNHQGRAYEIKKEIYRLPDRLIEALGLLFKIIGGSNGSKIELLSSNNHITEEARKNLLILDGIAKETRLRTYLNNGGQFESVRIFNIENPENSLLKAFNQQNYEKLNEVLYRYYGVALQLHDVLSIYLNNPSNINWLKENFYKISNLNKAKVNIRFLNYNKVIELLKEEVETLVKKLQEKIKSENYFDAHEHIDLSYAISMLYDAYINTNQMYLAKPLLENLLALYEKDKVIITIPKTNINLNIKKSNDEFFDVYTSSWASACNNLGMIFLKEKAYIKAEEHFLKAIELYERIGKNQSRIIDTLANIAHIFFLKSQQYWFDDKFEEAAYYRNEAKKHYLNLLKNFKSNNTQEIIYVNRAKYHLASILFLENDYEAAEILCLECNNNLNKHYNNIHPLNIDVNNLLMNIYFESYQYEKAYLISQNLLFITKFFCNHGVLNKSKLADMYASVANILIGLKKLDDALVMAKEAMNIYEEMKIDDPNEICLSYLHYIRALVLLSISYFKKGDAEFQTYLDKASRLYYKNPKEKYFENILNTTQSSNVLIISLGMFQALVESSIKNQKINEAEQYLYFMENVQLKLGISLPNTQAIIPELKAKLFKIKKSQSHSIKPSPIYSKQPSREIVESQNIYYCTSTGEITFTLEPVIYYCTPIGEVTLTLEPITNEGDRLEELVASSSQSALPTIFQASVLDEEPTSNASFSEVDVDVPDLPATSLGPS